MPEPKNDPPETPSDEPPSFICIMLVVLVPFGLFAGLFLGLEKLLTPEPRPYELVLTERGCEVLASRGVPTKPMALGMCLVAPERIVEGDCHAGYVIRSDDEEIQLRVVATEIVSRIEL